MYSTKNPFKIGDLVKSVWKSDGGAKHLVLDIDGDLIQILDEVGTCWWSHDSFELVKDSDN